MWLDSGRNEFPSSEQEARNHIQSIRVGRGVDDVMGDFKGNATSEDLQQLLNVVSKDLYHSSTHFLHELVQNADDNSYKPNTEPTIIITKGPQTFRIDCNERGFTKHNVEAICRSGHSSKKGANKAAGYIGEKGIGFKSVFKVAKQVWIKSGHYSFKFNRDSPLGMVIPCWATFPVPSRANFSSIYLELSQDYNEAELTKELAMLDARLLMFLRQLKRIEINISTGSTAGLDTKVLTRQDKSEILRELSTSNNVTKYFVYKHTVTNLPDEERRPGISTSDVVLAFPFKPLGNKLEAVITSQFLFAFLPVHDYGLSFMLQADFVLVANRENINKCDWNTALLNAVVSSYPNAVKALIGANPTMRYTWIRYLPTGRVAADSLHDFKTGLLSRLGKENILESELGTLKAPSSLVYVPKQFRDEDNIPITHTRGLSDRYLSHHYDDADRKCLEALGVRELSKEKFLEHLKTCLAERASMKSRQNVQWHSKLAKVLLRVASPEDLAGLPVIPLRDGTWVTPKDPAFFEPGSMDDDNSSQDFPKGIKIPIVDSQASKDPDRRLLLLHLGVKRCKQEAVARLIIHTHQSADFKPEKLHVNDLVAHAKFLYDARSSVPETEDVDLWIATDNGRYLRASAVYLHSNKPGAASRYLRATRNTPFGFAHAKYAEVFGTGDGRGLLWLETALRIAIWPRLVDPKYVSWDEIPTTTDARKVVHQDFLRIIDSPHSIDFLVLLAEGWKEHYGFFLEALSSSSKEAAKQQTAVQVVQNYLRKLPVPCYRGLNMMPLEDTILPLDVLREEIPWCLSFIDVPEPAHPQWACLANLGVSVTGDLKFYIQCLRLAKATNQDFSRIPQIMQQIQARAKENIPMLVDAMDRENLICRPASDGMPVWVSPDTCVWDGERWFRTVTSLRQLYPECERLFTNVLQCQHLDINHILMELHGIRNTCSIEYISSLLTLFQNLLKDGRCIITREIINICYSFKMFPVRSETYQGDEYDRLMSLEMPGWFFSDCKPLEDAFNGIVPMLAFDVTKVAELNSLFRLLQMNDRLLPEVAHPSFRTAGNVEEHQDLEMLYRSRGAFIVRLIPREHPSRSRFVNQLQNLVVGFCDEIYQQWTVGVSGKEVKSREIPAPVVIETKRDRLYITAEQGYGIDEPPLELADALTYHMGINKHHGALLLFCLMPSVKEKKLEGQFRNAGIPEYKENWDFTIEGGYQGPSTDDSDHGVGKITFGPFRPIDEWVRSLEGSVLGGFWGIALVSSSEGGGTSGASLPVLKNSPYKSGMGSLSMLLLKETVSKKTTAKDQFLGEKLVSKILEAILGEHYQPDSHWTSHYRVKAGFADYSASNTSRASFTVPDSSGRFAHYLAHKAHKKAAHWMKSRVIYHIEVMSTSDELDSPFNISNEELERAKTFSPSRAAGKVPEHVCIWVRIGNVKSTTGATVKFLVDPWYLWMIKKLRVDSVGGLLGKC